MLELLKNERYQNAIESIANNIATPKDYLILSLLYRMLDLYDDEATLIENYKKKFSLNEYFYDRIEWHKIPRTFYKEACVPYTLQIQNRQFLPCDDAINDMCFVTCVSSANLDFFLDNLASINNLEKYKKRPHFVVDTGLSEIERQLLTKKYSHIIIKSPPLDDYPEKMKLGPVRIANHSYPNFDKMTENYRYIFHVEADVWLYDQSPIDNLFWLCLQQGCGKNDPNSGLFCIDRKSGFLPAWQNMYATTLEERIKEADFKYHLQGRVMYKMYANMKLNYFSAIDQSVLHNAMVWNTGIPVMSANSNIYRHALTMQPITSIHMHGMCKCRKELTWVPTQKRQHPLISFEEFAKLIEFSRALLETGETSLEIPDKYNKRISLRYRMWPSNIKEIIKNELLKVVENA